jgi:hypothetical protein
MARLAAGEASEWRAVSAAKVLRRMADSKVFNRVASVWQINYWHRDSGEERMCHYTVESHPVKKADLDYKAYREARRRRYPGRTGGEGTVKKLRIVGEKSDALATRWVLKSYHRPVWPKLNHASLQRAACYLNAQGVDALVGKHAYEPDKSFMLMRDLSPVTDLDYFYRNIYMLAVDFSPAQTKSLTQAFVKMLARVAVFHQQERRPLLDLKARNIAPVIKGRLVTDLLLLDLDGSLGNRLVYTRYYCDKDDIDAIESGREELKVDGDERKVFSEKITTDIDFRLLAKVLSYVASGLGIYGFSFTELDGHYVSRIGLGGDVGLMSLYGALANAAKACSARDVVCHAFGHDSELYDLFAKTVEQTASNFASASAALLSSEKGAEEVKASP